MAGSGRVPLDPLVGAWMGRACPCPPTEKPFNQAAQSRGGLCGPIVPWDWFVVDLSYVLVLVGGGMIFRAKGVGVGTWMAFGLMSSVIGAFLFYFTYDAQVAFQASQGGVSAILNQGYDCAAPPAAHAQSASGTNA